MLRILPLFLTLSGAAVAAPPDSALSTDNHGNWLFVITTRADSPDHQRLSCVISTDDGQSWAEYPAPAAEAAEILYPSVAANPKGNWLLAWIQKDESACEAIVCATLSHNRGRWSKPEVLHEVPEKVLAGQLQVHATANGTWHVTSVMSSLPMDDPNAWFLLARYNGEDPWHCNLTRLPGELVGTGKLASVAWLPLKNERWYVGSVVTAVTNGPRDFEYRFSVYDGDSDSWTLPSTPTMIGARIDVPNILSLVRAANGQMLLVCGPKFSATDPWRRYSRTIRPVGDNVYIMPTHTANVIVPAASMGVPYYVDSGFDPGKVCLYSSTDDGESWTQLISEETAETLAIASTPVTDGSTGWLFATVGLNGFAVVGCELGRGGEGWGYPPRRSARVLRAGDLRLWPPYGRPQPPWRTLRCRTGLEINSCGTCKWQGWQRERRRSICRRWTCSSGRRGFRRRR